MTIRMRFGCPRVAARRKRPCLAKGRPFDNHKDVASDTRQGMRSATGSDWANHKAEVQFIWPVSPLHQLRLTTTGRKMAKVAGLMRDGQGGFPVKWGFILPILQRSKDYRHMPLN